AEARLGARPEARAARRRGGHRGRAARVLAWRRPRAAPALRLGQDRGTGERGVAGRGDRRRRRRGALPGRPAATTFGGCRPGGWGGAEHGRLRRGARSATRRGARRARLGGCRTDARAVRPPRRTGSAAEHRGTLRVWTAPRLRAASQRRTLV